MNTQDQTMPLSGGSTPRSGGFIGRWVRGLYDWVLHWADTPYALLALCVMSFAEASFFPIPPDVLLLAMCVGAPRRGLRFAAACSVASVLGGLAGYAIGALAWAHVAPWFYEYVPGFNAARFAQVQALYTRWGVAIVFTAGFSPIPYKIFTIASGVMGLPLAPFVGASAASRSARFFIEAGLIYRFGAQVQAFIDKYFNWLALAFSALLVGGFAAMKWVL